MSSLNLTKSFKIRTIGDLDELKKVKIAKLKELTGEIITEKYPLFKQMNNQDNDGMRLDIDRIRAACSNLEKRILGCTSQEEISDFTISLEELKRRYSL